MEDFIKEYSGAVSISGDGSAHLGDNNLNGSIHINQLTLLIREAQVQRLLHCNRASSNSHDSSAKPVVPAESTNTAAQGRALAGLWLEASDRIQDALHFREESFRQIAIKNAHSGTFGWIFQPTHDPSHSSLLNWLTDESGCFWVNGKAGSGKSTLMKYISQHVKLRPALRRWARDRELVVAAHYFWYAGTALQKSYEGILRSLLCQILASRPEITPIVFPGLERHIAKLKQIPIDGFSVLLPELQNAIDRLTTHLPEDLVVFLLIDGVDEYSGDVFEFCKSLTCWSSNKSVKILLSSRPIPTCCHIFAGCPNLRMQDLTYRDIQNYVDEELMRDELLLEFDRQEPGFAAETEKTLIEKASGVFCGSSSW